MASQSLPQKGPILRKNHKGIAFVLVKIEPPQIFDLNTPSGRPCQELLATCFSFEIGNCILKLWPLKVCIKTNNNYMHQYSYMYVNVSIYVHKSCA